MLFRQQMQNRFRDPKVLPQVSAQEVLRDRNETGIGCRYLVRVFIYRYDFIARRNGY